MPEKSLTDDSLKYLLQTSRGAEVDVDDFAQRFAHLDSRALRAEAAGYIEYRRRSLSDHSLYIFKLLIEIGSALDAVFESLQQDKTQSFEDWLTLNAAAIHQDTALNYRNLYKYWRSLPELLKEDASLLEKINYSLLYKLARKTVSQEAREWFIKQAKKNKDEDSPVDARYLLVAKYPEIRARLDSSPPELNIEQAYALALIFAGLDPLVKALVIEHRVKYAEVAQALHKLYLEFCKSLEDERPFKSWMLLVNNDFYFVWEEKTTGHEKRVALRDASPLDVHKFLEYRSWLHYQSSSKDKTRAVAEWHRDETGKVVLTLDAASFAVFDESDAGTVEVEILTQTLAYIDKQAR